MSPALHPPADSCWISPTPDTTRAAAIALGGVLGDLAAADVFTLALCGDLGAGKTLFAQGLAAGLGIDPALVASPTFTIASEYSLPLGARSGGVRQLIHLDLYRLEDPAELEAIGFVDLLEPGNVLAIEWADRFPSVLPADRLELRIERVGLADVGEVGNASAPAADRRLCAEARGPAAAEALARWETELEAAGLSRERG